MVMLADTDAGSVVTAAQSGARWGYALLPVQIALVPVLYLVMELSVRLGITTGKGHARLVKDCFGSKWAVLSVGLLLVSTTGALVTELVGLSGVGAIYGIPPAVTVLAGASLLAGIVLSGSHRRVERTGVGLGLFELAFVVAAVRSHPALHPMAASFATSVPGQANYLYMLAANVGAVVMPWMLFYQQSAVVDKGLGQKDLPAGRRSTAVGAVVTQAVMASVLIAVAAALAGGRGGTGPGPRTPGRGWDLTDIQGIWAVLARALGGGAGKMAFAVGVTGAALVAAIVVSLSGAWAFAEVAGGAASLNARPKQAPLFYGAYLAMLGLATLVALACGPSVQLTVAVEVSNSLLLPLVLALLLAAAWKALPARQRLGPARSALLVAVGLVVVALNTAVALHLAGI